MVKKLAGIITRGLGPNQKLITSGYGGKWKPDTKISETWVLELCPNCEIVLKNNIYFTRDIFSGLKIHKCSNCHTIIKWNGKEWIKVLEWFEDSW